MQDGIGDEEPEHILFPVILQFVKEVKAEGELFSCAIASIPGEAHATLEDGAIGPKRFVVLRIDLVHGAAIEERVVIFSFHIKDSQGKGSGDVGHERESFGESPAREKGDAGAKAEGIVAHLGTERDGLKGVDEDPFRIMDVKLLEEGDSFESSGEAKGEGFCEEKVVTEFPIDRI